MKKYTPRISVSLLAACVLISSRAYADAKLPQIFSDHAVLQKSEKTLIWGRAEARENVSVRLDGVTAQTTAGEDGLWKVSLNLKNTGPGPFELTVQGKNTIVLKDILVGEVWVCSGQSNMEFFLCNTRDGTKESAKPANPMLRQFLVSQSPNPSPQLGCAGTWAIAGPAKSYNFTAVGYYFGKSLQTELNTPVALINTSLGGTILEAWTSETGLKRIPELDLGRKRMLGMLGDPARMQREFREDMAQWLRKNDREDRPSLESEFTTAEVNLKQWTEVSLPCTGLGGIDKEDRTGIFWLRKTLTIPENMANKPAKIVFPASRDFETLYWNGVKVGGSTVSTSALLGTPRSYVVPAEWVKTGTAVVALRLFSPVKSPRIGGPVRDMTAGSLSLAGLWQIRCELAFPELGADAVKSAPRQPSVSPSAANSPSYLYNGMIHPLTSYTIGGVIWYQGEANTGRAVQYRTAFPNMIHDWRQRWGQGDFPFYFCQLANYLPRKDAPSESAWAELREAQAMALSVPNTGMAVLIDIGDANDIHPQNKKDAGERLALAALARTYGRNVEYSGPRYKAIQINGGQIRLSFDHAQTGLTAKPAGAEVKGFAICGKDRIWQWASARIDGTSLVVSSAKVPAPVAVRYAWADNPECNLYNGAGLPAVPFRTDDFPVLTQENSY